MRSKRLGFAMIFALVMSLVPFAAFAQNDQQVPTSAQINPAGSPPVVSNKWELPDMQSGVAGIQYGTVANPHQHDDDMNQVGIQFAPNLEDLPEARQVEYWWIVSDPNGIGDIKDAFVRVFHPDGSLKYQLHGTADYGQPTAANPLTPVACTALGSATSGMLEAAVHTGQMTAADVPTILDNCNKHVSLIFHAVGEMSKHQPAGTYTVIASGSDGNGNVGSLTNTFEVLPVIGLEADFSAVDFGDILPNTAKWVRGDLTWGGLPSVKNTGNVNMFLGVQFSKMTGAQYQKVIDVFDAQLNAQTYDPLAAGTLACFNNEPLGSNEIGQLDLSIHPGAIPADAYTGTLRLVGQTSCP
jgi:hypothetical protein